jgi:hypothetical protein
VSYAEPFRDGIIVAGHTAVRVWLKRKLADRIDDVDLSGRQIGDVLELSPREASLLVAEGHAEPDRRASIRVGPPESLRSRSERGGSGA